MIKFIIDDHDIILRGIEFWKISVAAFGFVKTLLCATFLLFILSLQTPKYKTDEIKNYVNFPLQNTIGKETTDAPMYEMNPNQLYPQVFFVINQMPNNLKFSEPLGNDRNLVFPLGIVPPNFFDSIHRNGLITSNTFLNNNINGNAHNISNNEIASTNNRYAPLSPPQFVFFCNFTQKKLKKSEKRGETQRTKIKKYLLTRCRVLVAWFFQQTIFFYIYSTTFLTLFENAPYVWLYRGFRT